MCVLFLSFVQSSRVGHFKHRNKKEAKKCYVLIFKKDIWKKKKTLLQCILQNILGNQTFERTTKFIEMKDIVALVTVDKMDNILKSLLGAGYWPRHKGGTGRLTFLLEFWFI